MYPFYTPVSTDCIAEQFTIRFYSLAFSIVFLYFPCSSILFVFVFKVTVTSSYRIHSISTQSPTLTSCKQRNHDNIFLMVYFLLLAYILKTIHTSKLPIHWNTLLFLQHTPIMKLFIIIFTHTIKPIPSQGIFVNFPRLISQELSP